MKSEQEIRERLFRYKEMEKQDIIGLVSIGLMELEWVLEEEQGELI